MSKKQYLAYLGFVGLLSACGNGAMQNPPAGGDVSSSPSSVMPSSQSPVSSSASPLPSPSPSSMSSSSSSISIVSSSSAPANVSSLIFQERQAGVCEGSYTVDTNNAGYTGAGFINTPNASGERVTWSVQSQQSGQFVLEFRFANGGGNDRSGELSVNAGSNGSFRVALSPTGSWAEWKTETVMVDLVQGKNILELSSTGAEGLANLDSLKIMGNGLSAGSCEGIVAPQPQPQPQPPSSGNGGSIGSSADCNDLSGHPVITVGNGGQYSKLQSAVNSVPKSNTKLTIIKIKPGTYREKVVIESPHIMLCGEKGKAKSTKITYNDDNKKVGSTKGTYTVWIHTNDVSVENITIENTFGKGSQAVALTAQGDRLQFRNTRFLGYQDTLYIFDGLQYYKNCYIEGRTDYIFGRGTGVFDNSTIHHVESGGALTAPKTVKSNKYGLVFLGGKLTARSGVGKASTILGRNWGADGSTVFIRTELGAHIKSNAWSKMGNNSLSTARFYEYKSTGPGANASARSSRQLSDNEAAAFTINKIFGSWKPSFSM